MNKTTLISLAAVIVVILLALIIAPRLMTKTDTQNSASTPPTATPPASPPIDPASPLPTGSPTTQAARDTNPFPQVAQAATPPSEVTLWEVDQNDPDTVFDGIPAKRVHTNPTYVEQFHVGQTLHLAIPQQNSLLSTTLTETRNHSATVNVWSGPLAMGDTGDSVIITRGPIETHVIVAGQAGTYTAIIDNATGNTVIVDQADINARQIPFEDGIPITPVEQEPPTP